MKINEIITLIIEGNELFTRSHPAEYFETFRAAQTPFMTLVTCSDSRVPLNALMPDTANRIFSIQNIGNQILCTEGSVDYGIYHLKTPLLMFMGHSDCGAIRAYLKGFDKETYGIKHELDFLRPMIIDHINTDDFNRLHIHTIEKNLDYQVNIACKKYRDLISSGELTVLAGYYDFRGDFGRDKGSVILVNVNKHKQIDEIRNFPEFSNLSPQQKIAHLDRLP